MPASSRRRLALLVGLVLPALALAQSAVDKSGTMLAVRMTGYGGPEVLRVERIPRPRVAAGLVLVKVRVASVNPYDWKFREGRLRAFEPAQLPVVPGIDFAGVVEAVGAGVAAWKPGDAVYGFAPAGGQGSYAEYVLAKPGELARKPASMAFDEAAAIPSAALTAWKALVDQGGVSHGATLLVQGGSGSVGLAAIQIARARGARSIAAVASTPHQALMREYGADVTVDYRTQRFEDVVRGVDFALDSVSAENARRTLTSVRRGGRLVLLSFPPDAARCEQAGVRCSFVASFRPDGDAFAQVAALVAAGKLRMPVGRSFPLAAAAEAQELVRRGGTPGKIVLAMP